MEILRIRYIEGSERKDRNKCIKWIGRRMEKMGRESKKLMKEKKKKRKKGKKMLRDLCLKDVKKLKIRYI